MNTRTYQTGCAARFFRSASFVWITMFTLSLSMSLSIVAQNQDGQTAGNRNTSSSWALKVGDQTISKKEFSERVNRRLKRAKANRSRGKKRRKSGQNAPRVNKDRVRQQVKEQLVDKLVLKHHASKSKAHVTEKELNRKWDQMVQKRYDGSEKKLKSALKKQGKSLSAYKKEYMNRMRERMLVNKFIEQKTDVSVTDEEIRSWYEKNKKRIGNRSFETIKDRIRKMLKRQKRSKKRGELVRKLKAKTEVKTNL